MAEVDDMIADHEAVVRVRLLTKKERGLKEPLESADGWVTVTLFGGDDAYGYDCRLLIAELRLVPGETYDLPAIFLSPELALERFPPGTEFRIWRQNRVIGRGLFVSHRAPLG
jgi:hypothetical protein